MQIIKLAKVFANLVLATFIFLCIFTRDQRFQNILMQSVPISSRQPKDIFCPEFPGCFRVASEGIQTLISQTVHIFFLFFYSKFKSLYILNELAISQWQAIISEFLFRTIMLFPFYCWLRKFYRNNFISKILLVISIGLIISGFPLSFIHTYFGVFFTRSDFSVFFIIGIFLLIFEKLSLISSFMMMFTSTLFFEHLGLVIFISLFTLRKDLFSSKKKIMFLVSSIFTGPILLLLIQYLANKNCSYLGFGNQYYQDNVKFFWRTFFALTAMFIKIIMLGLISYKLSRNLHLMLSERLREIKILLLAFSTTYVIGFFNSGIAHEGARQTIVGQILLYLYSIVFFGNHFKFGKKYHTTE